MAPEFESIFLRLRTILENHSGTLVVSDNTPRRYCLEGDAGPATIQSWGGKVRKKTIPVAWVQIGKAYVSFHIMGMYGNTKLRDQMSKRLKARMQGETCFNFKRPDETLFDELEQLTAKAIAGFRKAGFVSE